jgi:hypothetical protein
MPKREVERQSETIEALPQDYIEALIDLRECVRRIRRLADLEERKLPQKRRAGASVRSNGHPQGNRPSLSVEAERLDQIQEKISAITKNRADRGR